MKLEITQKGAHNAEGKEHKVGSIVEIEDGPIPGYLVGKCRKVSDGEGKTAVTNPANDPVKQPDAGRAELMGEACKVIDEDDFSDDGVPDVRAINGMLSDDAEKFSAAERDAIWPEIADAVKAAREAS